MDYEQRYKEALDEAKAIHKAIKQDLKPVIEQIFPELKESDDERIRKAIICGMNALKKGNRIYFADIYIDDILAWLEKQREQKYVDKIEPKFHEGDWVVTDKGDTVQIGTVNNDYYTIGNGMLFSMPYVDAFWHLWANQDIKDGDILCTYECGKPKIVFIFKGAPRTYHILKYYCYYNIMYPYFEPDAETGCLAVNDGNLKPATKEQRDILFQKMKEDGYIWDEDKKELIKL